MSFKVNQQHDARRLWTIALEVTRTADHPLRTDQTVFVLYDLAQQALALGRPDEALSLVSLGHAAAPGPRPASASTLSCLTTGSTPNRSGCLTPSIALGTGSAGRFARAGLRRHGYARCRGRRCGKFR